MPLASRLFARQRALWSLLSLLAATAPVAAAPPDRTPLENRGPRSPAGAALERIESLELGRAKWPSVSGYLAHSSGRVRGRAALALGRLAPDAPGVRAAITSALIKERAREARRWLLFALGQSQSSATTLTAFIALRAPFAERSVTLKLTEAERQRELSWAIAALGRAGSPPQLLLLKDRLDKGKGRPLEATSLAIALILRRAKSCSQSLASTLEQSLIRLLESTKSAELAWRLCYALDTLNKLRPGHAATAALSRRLAPREDPRVQAFAARALGRLAALTSPGEKRPPPPEALLRAGPWPWTAATEAIKALEGFDASLAAPAVLRFTRHPSFHARRAAAAALGRWARQERLQPEERDTTRAALLGLLEDAWETVRGEALVSLTALEGRAPEALKTFSQEGIMARRAAIRALASLPEPKLQADQRALIEALARDPDHRCRVELMGSFGVKPGERGRDLALSGLRDPELSVAGTALESLSKRGDLDLLPPLEALYKRSVGRRDRYELREMICRVLAEQSSPEAKSKALGLLRRILEGDPRTAVRRAAAEALEGITGERPELASTPSALKTRPRQEPVRGRSWLRFETERGPFVVELNAELTPDHVRNIHDLLRRPSPRDGKRGFYRGLSWHRVVSHFVVQGGCPRGDGWGDPGWTLPDELTDLPFLRGALGMPKAGPDTGGCQLFFCHAPTPHLDGRYTLFGYVRSGFETVDLLEEGDLILGVSVIAKGGRHGH